LSADGTVSLVTNSLASGHHLIKAHYGGDPDFAPSDSNTVDVFVGNLDGPTLTDVSRFGYHMHPTTLVLTFSAAVARVPDHAHFGTCGGPPSGRPGIITFGVAEGPNASRLIQRRPRSTAQQLRVDVRIMPGVTRPASAADRPVGGPTDRDHSRRRELH
jgi:hypothetical protein